MAKIDTCNPKKSCKKKQPSMFMFHFKRFKIYFQIVPFKMQISLSREKLRCLPIKMTETSCALSTNSYLLKLSTLIMYFSWKKFPPLLVHFLNSFWAHIGGAIWLLVTSWLEKMNCPPNIFTLKARALGVFKSTAAPVWFHLSKFSLVILEESKGLVAFFEFLSPWSLCEASADQWLSKQ